MPSLKNLQVQLVVREFCTTATLMLGFLREVFSLVFEKIIHPHAADFKGSKRYIVT